MSFLNPVLPQHVIDSSEEHNGEETSDTSQRVSRDRDTLTCPCPLTHRAGASMQGSPPLSLQRWPRLSIERTSILDQILSFGHKGRDICSVLCSSATLQLRVSGQGASHLLCLQDVGRSRNLVIHCHGL